MGGKRGSEKGMKRGMGEGRKRGREKDTSENESLYVENNNCRHYVLKLFKGRNHAKKSFNVKEK